MELLTLITGSRNKAKSVVLYKEFFNLDYPKLLQIDSNPENQNRLKSHWGGILNHFVVTKD